MAGGLHLYYCPQTLPKFASHLNECDGEVDVGVVAANEDHGIAHPDGQDGPQDPPRGDPMGSFDVKTHSISGVKGKGAL